MGLAESVASRLRSADFDQWMSGASRIGFCSNPVRLAGSSATLDPNSGEVIREFTTASQPDGLTYTRCGNRRARRCESCSHEYKGDTWHMIMAGAAGGMKGVPETVAEHPMVFVTLTAPSFGAVHSIAGSRARGKCVHGRSRGCSCCHEASDPVLGDPMCEDCYDYDGHVVWQYFAPELWRRFTIQLRRSLAHQLGMTQRAAAEIVRLQPIVRRDGLDGALSDRAVAAYIAKYATKATEDLDGRSGGRAHICRIKATAELICEESGAEGPYTLLAKWAHMLGFRGHFSSKSRRYSVTLGSLRGARRRWRLDRIVERAQEEGHDIHDVLVIGDWSFAGMGWRTDGDRALAIEAARAAREWRDAHRVRFHTTNGEKDA